MQLRPASTSRRFALGHLPCWISAGKSNNFTGVLALVWSRSRCPITILLLPAQF